MSKFIGRLCDFGIAKETTRGTAETTATFFLPKLSLTYDDKIMQAVDESSIGVIEDSPDAVVVGKKGEGEFEGKIGDKSIGLLLLSTLGNVSTTTTQSTAYIHTFSVQEDCQCDSLTLFQEDPNQDYKYALAMIDSFELSAAIGEYSKVKCAFKSKVGATATLSPSYSTENNFLPQHGSFGYASSLAGLDAATDLPIRTITLTINKNVDEDRKLGSLDPSDILNRQMSVEGTVEFIFTDNTFKTEMLADTVKAVRFRLTNSDITIGSSLNPRLTVDLARVKFSEVTRNFDNDNLVTVTAKFKAFYSISDSQMIAVELRNAQVSY